MVPIFRDNHGAVMRVALERMLLSSIVRYLNGFVQRIWVTISDGGAVSTHRKRGMAAFFYRYEGKIATSMQGRLRFESDRVVTTVPY